MTLPPGALLLLASPETGLTSNDHPAVGGRCRISLGPLRPGLSRLSAAYDKAEESVMPVTSAKHSISTPVSLSQRIVIAAGASLLGLCLIYFAGFSHIEAVHNAAHDTRHSAAFPCH